MYLYLNIEGNYFLDLRLEGIKVIVGVVMDLCDIKCIYFVFENKLDWYKIV